MVTPVVLLPDLNPTRLIPDDINMLSNSLPGSYILIVRLKERVRLCVGKLPERGYPAGWYAYAGSALGGLRQRLSRYLKADRKLHWHIDYLLEHGTVTEALIIAGKERLECRIAEHLGGKLETIKDFGSSDCKCSGHLFYHKEESYVTEAVTSAGSRRFA